MNLVIRRVPASLFVVLGPLLVALAACGIYAVVSYAVARRTREIGVRLALGGSAPRVTRQIVAENMRVIAAGATAGWLGVYVVVHPPGARNADIVAGVRGHAGAAPGGCGGGLLDTRAPSERDRSGPGVEERLTRGRSPEPKSSGEVLRDARVDIPAHAVVAAAAVW